MGSLTKRRRFAVGLALAYCVKFPLGIHSVRILKLRWAASTETPSKGRMFSWDKCFQVMISRHKDWAIKVSDSGGRGRLKIP